jgi:hypothetical protein
MRKTIAPIIILAIAYFIDFFGTLFKILYLPMANELLIISTGLKVIGFIYLAVILIRYYNQKDNHASKQ